MTFTLDEPTVAKLRQSAARLDKAQSEVVREAIADYAERVGRLSERERLHLLRLFDSLVPGIPTRSAREVDAEIRAIRASRRHGGRRRQAGRRA